MPGQDPQTGAERKNAEQDGIVPPASCCNTAQGRTEDKDGNDPIVVERLAALGWLAEGKAVVKGFGGAAQVSGAHSGGIGIGFQPPEGLHLQAAEHSDQNIGSGVVFTGNQRSDDCKQDFNQQDRLLPVQQVVPFKKGLYHFGKIDSQGKADNGDQVLESTGKITGSQVHAQFGHVASLTIGKDMVPRHIGITFKKAADYGEKGAEQQGFRGIVPWFFQNGGGGLFDFVHI